MLYLKSISRSDRRCSLFVVFFVARLLWTFASRMECSIECFMLFFSLRKAVCCFWIRCGICGPSHDRICFMYGGASIFSKFMVCCLALSPFGLKSWLYTWLDVKMSRCRSCFKPSTREDRIRSHQGQVLCNKCFRSLSCHRCHACVQRSSPRMIEFLYIPGL